MPFERFPKNGNWARPSPRNLLKWGGAAGWILTGYALYEWLRPQDAGWDIPAGWNVFWGCDYEPEFAHTLLYNACIHNQAGVNDAGEPPFILQRAVTGRRRWGAGIYRYNLSGNGRGDHIMSYYKDFFPPDPAAAPTETKPTDIPRWHPEQRFSPPSVSLGWGPMRWPDWMPVAPGFALTPSTPPLGEPVPLNPGTPQWPERWYDFPDTVPFPGLEPILPPIPSPQPWPHPDAPPPVVPSPDPESPWQTNPEAVWRPDNETVLHPNGRAVSRPRPDRKPKRPPRGTKERKVRLRGAAAALWRSFNPITEFADAVQVLYNCIPYETRRSIFFKLRRQPKAAEQMAYIYRYINDIDMGCVITGYIANQVEDFILGRIGRLEAEANQRNPFGRPLGYGAGYAL